MDLFVYGTLMIPRVMEAVTSRTFAHREAQLSGYARYRMVDAPYPGLMPEAGASTRGMLYTEIDAASWERLDHFEGGEYQRVNVQVDAGGTQRSAWTYVLRPEHRHRLTNADWDLDQFTKRDLNPFLGEA